MNILLEWSGSILDRALIPSQYFHQKLSQKRCMHKQIYLNNTWFSEYSSFHGKVTVWNRQGLAGSLIYKSSRPGVAIRQKSIFVEAFLLDDEVKQSICTFQNAAVNQCWTSHNNLSRTSKWLPEDQSEIKYFLTGGAHVQTDTDIFFA